MKRFISLIFAIIMVAAMVPGMAFAADESTPIEYNITTDALTEAAKKNTYNNNALSNVSWLAKGSATAATLDVPSSTAAYQMSYRLGGSVDNAPTLASDAFFSQFVVNQWKNATKYPTGSGEGDEQTKDNYSTGAIQYGIRIKVENDGNYKLSLSNNLTLDEMTSNYASAKYFFDNPLNPTTFTSGAVVKVYFAKATTVANTTAEGSAVSRQNETNALVNEAYESKFLGFYDSRITGKQAYDMTLSIPEAGEYYVIFKADDDCLNNASAGNSNVYSAKTKTLGEYYKTEYQLFVLSNITLTPVAEEQPAESEEEIAMKGAIAEEVTEEGLSGSSYVNVITTSVDSEDSAFKSTVEKIKVSRGEAVTVEADTIEGYDFLYWRSGLGADAKVITNNPECTVKAVPGTWLTAVYKAADLEKVSVLFYNADGDIIKNELVAEEAAITFPNEPDAPAGCGEFIGWALNKKDNIVTSANASENSMVFVAQYKDQTEKNITVNVPSGATGGGNYAYGDKVTVTATECNDESNVFVYWKKGDEIVSFDEEYTFNAFENCELTAVYAEYKPVTEALRKIIISENGENIMAEFIGLDAAVEKGVIFRDSDETDVTDVTLGNATHKIAMTTNGNHLAALNDVGNYIGYAILANCNVIYDK